MFVTIAPSARNDVALQSKIRILTNSLLDRKCPQGNHQGTHSDILTKCDRDDGALFRVSNPQQQTGIVTTAAAPNMRLTDPGEKSRTVSYSD